MGARESSSCLLIRRIRHAGVEIPVNARVRRLQESPWRWVLEAFVDEELRTLNVVSRWTVTDLVRHSTVAVLHDSESELIFIEPGV